MRTRRWRLAAAVVLPAALRFIGSADRVDDAPVPPRAFARTAAAPTGMPRPKPFDEALGAVSDPAAAEGESVAAAPTMQIAGTPALRHP